MKDVLGIILKTENAHKTIQKMIGKGSVKIVDSLNNEQFAKANINTIFQRADAQRTWGEFLSSSAPKLADEYQKICISLVNENLIDEHLCSPSVKNFVMTHLGELTKPVEKLKILAVNNEGKLLNEDVQKISSENRGELFFPLINEELVGDNFDVASNKALILNNLDKLDEPVTILKKLASDGKLPDEAVQVIYAKAKTDSKYKEILLDSYVEGILSDTMSFSDPGQLYGTVSKNIEIWVQQNKPALDEKIIAKLNETEIFQEEKSIRQLELHSLYSNEHANTKIILAIINQTDVVKLNGLDQNGHSLLQKACFDGQVEIAKKLIDKGSDPFTAKVSQADAISMLFRSDNKESSLEIFQHMMKNPELKVNIIARDNSFLYPLLAMKMDNQDLAAEFLSKAAKKREILSNILLRAVKSDDVQLVKNFFKLDASADFYPSTIAYEGDNISLLSLALKAGTGIDSFRAILESGNKHITINDEILKEAIESGNFSAVNALLKYSNTENGKNLNINFTLKDGGSITNLLNTAYEAKKNAKDPKIIAGIEQSINLLITHNVGAHVEAQKQESTEKPKLFDVNTAFANGENNVLIRAYNEFASSDQKGAAQKTLYNMMYHPKANLNMRDENGKTLLMLAAARGDKDSLGLAVVRGRDHGDGAWHDTLDQVDNDGNSAIFYASRSGQFEVFQLLNIEGASLTTQNGELIKNNKGTTPLMEACTHQHIDIIKEFEPTHLNRIDNNGNNALHYLTMSANKNHDKSSKILDMMLDSGMDINTKNSEGKTPLMLAVINGHVDLVTQLITKGADINAVDKDGNNALIYACLLNQNEVIAQVLTSDNLDLNHRNKQGVSPFLIAAHRDGLESRYQGGKMYQAMEDMTKKLSSSMQDRPLPIQDQKFENAYKDLPSILVNQGADPYLSKPIYLSTSIRNIVSALIAQRGTVAASDVIANAAPAYGSGIISVIAKHATTFYASYVIKNEVRDAVFLGVKSFMTNDTTSDYRINLKDKVMIGSFHNGMFGIKYGLSLQQDLAQHENFKDSNASFTKDSLAKRFKDMPMQFFLDAYQSLTDQYSSVQKTIKQQPWYYAIPLPQISKAQWGYKLSITSKSSTLSAISKEILNAHQALVESPLGKKFLKSVTTKDSKSGNLESFEGAFKSVIDIVKSPKESVMLLQSMVKNDNNVQDIASLVKKVVDKEIALAPDTYYAFKNLNTKITEVTGSQKAKEAFIAHNKSLSPLSSPPDIDSKIVDSFIKATMDAKAIAHQVTNQNPNNLYLSMAVEECKRIMKEDNPHRAAAAAAGIVAEGVGYGAGIYTAAQIDPEMRAVLMQAVTAGSTILKDGAISFIKNPVASIGAVVAVVGSVVAYQNREAIANGVAYGANAMGDLGNYLRNVGKAAFAHATPATKLEDQNTKDICNSDALKIATGGRESVTPEISALVSDNSPKDKKSLISSIIKFKEVLTSHGVGKKEADEIVKAELLSSDGGAKHDRAVREIEALEWAAELVRSGDGKEKKSKAVTNLSESDRTLIKTLGESLKERGVKYTDKIMAKEGQKLSSLHESPLQKERAQITEAIRILKKSTQRLL